MSTVPPYGIPCYGTIQIFAMDVNAIDLVALLGIQIVKKVPVD
jgi:hypothetical protein